MCFSQNVLKKFYYKYTKKYQNNLCRFCNEHVEDINHVFNQCSKVDVSTLKFQCIRNGVGYNLSNLFTDGKLKKYVELFILKNL